MNLDKCIHPCHHHHIKDIKHFHHPQSPLSLLSQLIPLSYPLNQWSATYHRLGYFSRVSNKCNHTVYTLLSGFFCVIIHVSLYHYFIFLLVSVVHCINIPHHLYWFQFSSVAQSCPTLCDRMDCSKPGLLVPHVLPEFAKFVPKNIV